MTSGLILVFAIFMTNLIMKKKHKFSEYLLVFILGILASFIFVSKAESFELCPIVCQLDEEQIDEYERLALKHRRLGDQATRDAEKLICLIPDLTDEQKSMMCFRIFVAGVAFGTPYSKIVTMFMTFMTEYMILVKDEWNKIQTFLHTAQYHYELQEFYEDVVEKAIEL